MNGRRRPTLPRSRLRREQRVVEAHRPPSITGGQHAKTVPIETPARVVRLDLAETIHDIEVPPPYRLVYLLVFEHGCPLGTVRLQPRHGRCTAAAVRAAVDEELGAARERRRFRVQFGPPRPEGDASTITVAVCTRNRPDDLDRCLTALAELRPAPLELLVVDNAPSDDRTRRLVRDRHPQVRYLVEPEAGLDRARNRAIVEARGEIVAFTDDDVVVGSGWVGALAGAFALDPEISLVTGLVLPLELETAAQGLFEDYGGFGRGPDPRWFRFSSHPRRRLGVLAGGTGKLGTGANMAFRKEVFDRLGGFDPALDVGTPTGGGGDLEMFYRVLKAGGTAYYEPRAWVLHRHRRSYRELACQLTAHGTGLTAYFARSVAACPAELPAFLHLVFLWLRWWSLPRLVRTALGRLDFPWSLTFRELLGLGLGPFYFLASRWRRPCRDAAPTLPPGPPPALVAGSPPSRREAQAVRQIELSEPIPELEDVAGYETIRLIVTHDQAFVETVTLPNLGTVVSARRVLDHLAVELSRLEKLPISVRREEGDLRRPARSASPGVSVVIATRNRPEALERCLESIRRQALEGELEIVVVDNDPQSGQTRSTTSDEPEVRLVEEPRPGLSFARNAGIRAARGAIIVTTDDDVVAPPGWLARLTAPFSDPSVAAVTGNVVPLELETRSQVRFEQYGGLGKGSLRRVFDREWLTRSRFRPATTWSIGATANAAFRAELFRDPEIGLLAEYLGAGMPAGVGEDTLLFYRILARGGRIVYEPRAWLWHDHRRTDTALRRQLFDYSRGHVAYHLVTLTRDRDPRALVRLGWELPAWHARRSLAWLTGRGRHPLRLVLLEIAGHLLGPLALLQSVARARRLSRDQTPAPVDKPGASSSPA